jgi:ubiquitin carboxyl-terminal hydrolase 5/13
MENGWFRKDFRMSIDNSVMGSINVCPSPSQGTRLDSSHINFCSPITPYCCRRSNIAWLVPLCYASLYLSFTAMSDKLSLDLIAACRVATPHDAVYNSECVFTFHSPFTTEEGIVVNLATFVGTCQSRALSKTGERGLFLRIVKKRVLKAKSTAENNRAHDEPKPAQPTKLGIGVEGGFASEDDKYEIISTYSIVQLERKNDVIEVVTEIPFQNDTKTSLPEPLTKSAESIIHHAGMAIQQDLKVWELDDEPKPVSKYAANLPFVDNGVVISPEPSTWKCEKSGDTENLWLNLSDGYIGGGRKNWDGTGGSNGALDHYTETGEQYPLVVKLGTITGADLDTADCYSYARDEDGPVKIPNLAALLEKRGIHVTGM